MTLLYTMGLVILILAALVLLSRPLWEVALGRSPLTGQSSPLHRPHGWWQPGRVKVLARYCTPCVELALAVHAGAMGAGLLLTPGVMTNGSGWARLAEVADQEFWSIAALALAVAQVLAVISDLAGPRAVCLVVTLAWWWRIAWNFAQHWPEGIGVFLYGSIALIAAVALLTFSWEAGHRGRVG